MDFRNNKLRQRLRKVLLYTGIFLFLFAFQIVTAKSDTFKSSEIYFDEIYVLRLNNGDILTGKVLQIDSVAEKGKFIKFETILGNPVIYESEVVEIHSKFNENRHRHRHFIMPSAFEIGNDHFISNFELGLLYVGFGISDFISITAGRTLVPVIRAEEQGTVLNAKITVYDMEWESMPGGMKIALGSNLAFVNNKNRFTHLYGNFTFYGAMTDITGTVFVKTGSEDIYDIRYNNELVNFIYEDGSFGLGLGITTKLSTSHSIYFLGEVWNSNIAKRTNTALLGAIRIANNQFSADFGLVFMTAPFLFPVVNFTWTPF